jgi:hypothetical protein
VIARVNPNPEPMPPRKKVGERMALLHVSPEMLVQLLQLPAGAYVDRIQEPIDRNGSFVFRIRGAGWETNPGNVIGTATASITRTAEVMGLRFRYSWEQAGNTP